MGFLVFLTMIFNLSWMASADQGAPLQLKDCFREFSQTGTKAGVAAKLTENGQLDERCLPDTLYSWMGEKVVPWYEVNQREHPELLSSGFFFWRTPLGTYGYGDMSIRIKLKKGVHFRDSGKNWGCADLTGEMVGNTVNVKTFMWPDYVICSFDTVESWSYGRPEHLEEMEQELRWIDQHKDGSLSFYVWDFVSDGWLQNMFCNPFRGGSSCTIDAKINSHVLFTRDHLNKNLQLMKKYVNSNSGKVYVNKGHDPRTGYPIFQEAADPVLIQQHFSTDKNIFFFYR